MGVDAAFGLGFQDLVVGREALAHPVHVQRPAAVGDVDAVGAVVLHQLGLGGQRIRGDHVAHHQEAGDVHAEVARGPDVLAGDVGLGAVGRDANRAHPDGMGVLQLVDGADAGQKERGELGVGHDIGHRLDPLPVGVGAEAVVEAGAVQPVAVRHLDGVDVGVVQRLGDGADVVQPVLVTDGVHPVAQRHVLDVELVGVGIEGHQAATFCWRRSAILSAVARAAEVMMSRLPA